MTAEQAAAWEKIEAAARKEGSVTVYALAAALPEDQMGRFREAWNKDSPDVKVEITGGNPSDITARVSTELQANTHAGDVSQGGVTSSRQLDSLGAIEPFIPPASQDPSVKWHVNPITDEARRGTNFANTLSYVPIFVNAKLVKPEDEPKTHLALTDPKWNGKIVWWNPWTAGFGWYEYYFSKQVYGPDWVTKMRDQNVTFITDTNNALNMVARGEYAVAIANPGGSTATRLIKDGQPLKAVWPDDFTYGTPTGYVVLKGAPHPNAAKVFANWWFSDAGQRFIVSLGGWPNRVDLPPEDGWEQGFTHPRDYFWFSKTSDDFVAEPVQKEAAGFFKK